MLLHLLTAGVLLTAALMALAFKAPWASKEMVMPKAPVVRLRGKLPVGEEAVGFSSGGVFASSHAIPSLVRALYSARVEGVMRAVARPVADETFPGFNGYPAFLR